ncbi:MULTISPECIES: hypothetical protein [Vibrio]|uniref:hypothetical protein n=1 Tax=Vibrio TaxID=662 RepID=UPI0013C2DBA1|nr:hypothetical protein [Vibrio cholerae]EHD2268128.1 hypothetical protein [Vibrio cholerae]EIJ2219121.1 hypothetical protein [Vibrio cholerae]EIN5953605.1 hypothetical protein [Vibrio cholerae]EIV0337084.1 hypothetical protein [Vibrio cholerae]EJL6632407.1 hypothetical protein [Vibrio cholerae]
MIMTQQEFELFLEAKYPQLFGTDIALGASCAYFGDCDRSFQDSHIPIGHRVLRHRFTL